MSAFAQLLNDIDTLAKAQPAGQDDDAKIAAAAGEEAAAAAAEDAEQGKAAAAEGGADAGEGEGEGEGDGAEGAGAEGEEGDPMAKSFPVTLPDGTQAEALDATELLKSLTASVESINAERAAENEHLSKALGIMTDLLKAQGETIASLRTEVTSLRDAGRGRKAVVTVFDKDTPLAKSEVASSAAMAGFTPNDFMAKALSAQEAGRITGRDVAIAETYINRGQTPPAEIIAKVTA